MDAKRAKLELSPSINDLPNEMCLKIFSYLPQIDHYAVAHVSNHFQNLIDSTKWGLETPLLEITEENVTQVKEAIEKKQINNKFCLKRIKVNEVTNIVDLEFILQSIGKEIQDLYMRGTAAFHLLKDSVLNLKSFEINFDAALENSVNDGSFDLKFFPLLEKLSFMDNGGKNSTTKKLLEQLKSTENTISLKHFKLRCHKDIVDYLMESLLHHAGTLESLELIYFHFDDKHFNKWKIPFCCLKNLKKLCLTGYFTPETLNTIFSILPKETPLEHLVLVQHINLDYNETLILIVKKWMNTLQYLEIYSLNELIDVTPMELGKLKNLRVLKLLKCIESTEMGLAGIAKEQNNFMDELNLQNIPNLDELGLCLIASRFPNLRVLMLHNIGKAITNTSLQSIFRFSTRLRSLSIKGSNITDEGLIGTGNDAYSIIRLRFLVKLTLENCESLTDRSLIEGFKFPALRSLELGQCQRITLKGIESLVKSCPLLEFLSLPSAVFINEKSLFVIGNGSKRLRQLNITGCNKLADNVSDHITDVFKAMQNSTTNITFSPDCKLIFK